MMRTMIQQQLLPSKHPQFINQALLKKYGIWNVSALLSRSILHTMTEPQMCAEFFSGFQNQTDILPEMCYTILCVCTIVKEAERIAKKQ